VPTTVRWEVIKGFDMWGRFDDEMIENCRDIMSWFLHKDHEMLNQIPANDANGFFFSEFEKRAFNICDF
jgi:hypothetical protein